MTTPGHDVRPGVMGTHAKGGLAGWQARRLQALADGELAELTVGKMAAAVDLSPSHFSRAFRSTFGVPPRAWLRERRLDAARRRLLETGDTVERIAFDLGYPRGELRRWAEGQQGRLRRSRRQPED